MLRSTLSRVRLMGVAPGIVGRSLSARTGTPTFFTSATADSKRDPVNAAQIEEGEKQGEQVRSAASRAAGKASRLVTTLLHGAGATREGGSELEDISETYSKVLARGKYVHELQWHKIKPECVDAYAKLVERHYPYIAAGEQQDVKLCGSWSTLIGEEDEAIHLWEYTGYTGHAATMDRLRNDPLHAAFLRELRPMLRERSNQICLEFAFWATMAPSYHGGVYELRSYKLKPGNLLEWETNWRRGLECRRQFCEPVGAWFSQLGRLNYVHHMWQYPDLESRKRTREQAWSVDGWSETVYNTVRLIDDMNSVILVPLPFSPLK
ncbi:hypothetical protein THASP1DRAFT_30055 [Thamnocephalis sphaerospora]|uniref:NIPSNAP domain-containing protein n=1 Tax=Thamnocephalis sphaerospora TaxID=78915 RepID=A0A4P9XQ47_9FUNG|nr:hypothetical protein THASP1DRAFT_30055 [Thamnocephalis sphaerospora]|eukprot:RKP08138.1 hypothetical protein THASP1DRAFT_30055 [Thamnocephalis sphaerospora]